MTLSSEMHRDGVEARHREKRGTAARSSASTEEHVTFGVRRRRAP